MSRRSPPALPPQPEDPVPVEHDSDDGDGGALMVDAWPASLHFPSMSPPRLLPPCSAWATMVVVGHLPPSLPLSPTESIQLWNHDDEQWPPQQMGPIANCFAALVKIGLRLVALRLRIGLDHVKFQKHLAKDHGLEIHMNTETGGTSLPMIESYDDDNELGEISRKCPRDSLLLRSPLTVLAEDLAEGIRDLGKIFLLHGLQIPMNTETGGSSLPMIESYNDDSDRINRLEEKLDARMRVLEKIFLSHGWEIPMNTETGGSSLPMIKSYDDYNDRINRARAPRRGPASVSSVKQLAAVLCDMAKCLKSYGLEIDMNIEIGGISLAMIESYIDDNELGDNDAQQSEISRKCPRSRSLVWLHFTKVLSKDSGMVTAMCKHCNNALKGASTLGTSHLLRHLKNVHQMDLSSLSEAWKEPQRSSCSQKLENTGSAACAGIPTPLTENNGNELQDKDFKLGDTSRKRLKVTSRTKSAVWLHFTKLPSANPGGDMAECNHCKTTLKAGSQKIGTSSLRRHLEKVHQINFSLSEAWKEPQRSSCSQKLQSTGSAACAGIPTPLTENNGNDLLDKDFELGDTSRKRLKGTSSSGYSKDKI